MEELTYEETLRLNNPMYVDVRAPVEFNEDHIPGAVNLPIFNDEERKEVGTLYKMSGRDTAVIRGTEIGSKRISDIISPLLEIKGRDIVIYCARGGMRSGAVSSLVNSLGISTYRVKDGYKSYRRFIRGKLASMKIVPQIFILQGLTGAGKTEIIRMISNAVDIEAMAGHRSSLFGAIGLRQHSQKYFETLLFGRLNDLADQPYVIFEGESRKVGNLHIPENIFRQMREAPAIFIDTPIERRIEIIKREYTGFNEDEKIINTVMSMRSRLGNKKTEALIEYYNKGNLDSFIEILLVDYYDKLYHHTLDEYEYLAVIKNFSTEKACGEILEVISKRLCKDSGEKDCR
jgi:tRNA 2-selenouridine synthase